MVIYFKALIGTLLLMTMAAVAAAIAAWALLSMFHASHTVEVYGIGITEIGVLIASVFVFRMVVGVEREIAETQSDLIS